VSPSDVVRARLARLWPEAPKELSALAVHATRLRESSPALQHDQGSLPLRSVVAVELHAWYTAAVALLERTARAVDGALPDGDDSHREQLVPMAADLSPTRPPVLSRASLVALDELRRFRHFFRHASAVDLDPVHVLQHRTTVARCHAPATAELCTALGRVREVLAQQAR
jgi:hypothetical protein